jgi:hypothetical protein
MIKTKTISMWVMALTILMVLTACAGEPAEPTPDPAALFTQAAQTVVAQITETALANPTATETVAPSPTNTMPPTAIVATDAGVGGQPASGVPTISLPGISTPTSSAVTAGDKCQWVSNYPADGEKVSHYNAFDIYWVIKNVGTTTWTTKYMYQQYPNAENNIPVEKKKYYLPKEVKPGEEIKLPVDVSDMDNDTYYNLWVLTNEQLQNFCNFDITFQIGDAPTKTPAPGDPTSTPRPEGYTCCVLGAKPLNDNATSSCKNAAANAGYGDDVLSYCQALGYDDLF